MNASTTSTMSTAPASGGKGRQAAIIGGGIGLFALGALATALIVRAPQPSEGPAVAGAPAVVAATTAADTAAPAAAPVPAPATAAAPAAPVVAAKAPPKAHATKPPGAAPAVENAGTATPPAPAPAATTPLETQHAVAQAPVCANCGVIESVTPVVQKGEGSGLGAVAGGVLGGVLGHQMGGGTGKKAMTVIGAVGGGLAGHEVEKRARSTTLYQHKIRMADGSTRTITQAQQLAVGLNVHVDGTTITPAPAEGGTAPGGARSVGT